MQSIRFHLLIALLITGLLPVGIIYFVTGHRTVDALIDGEYSKIKEMSVQVAGQLKTVMARAADDLESLASNPFLTDVNVPEEDQRREMNRLVRVYDKFSDITLYDPEGYILISTTESQPENYEHSTWFKRALEGNEGEPVISDPHKILNDPLGRLYLSVFIPVLGEEKKVVMVVKARIPFDNVWELLNEVKLGENGYMVLVDSKGNYLTHNYRNKVLSKFEEDFDIADWRNNAKGFYNDDDEPGLRSLYVSLVLPETLTQVDSEWLLIAFEPEEEVRSLLVKQKRYQAGVAFATLIFVVALGYFLGTLFSRPLIHASAVAGAVARGSTAARIADAGPREVRELAGSFNKMAEEVQHHRDHLQSLVQTRTMKLEDSQMRLRNLSAQLKASYDAAVEAILVIGLDGEVIAANRKVGEFFGLDSETMEGERRESIGEKICGCFVEGNEFRAGWDDLAADSESVREVELNVVRPRELVLSMYSAPVKGRDGEVLARLWMFRDLTEQRHLQANLEQSQKMDAIGRLAGGVAHDFNNLLTGIIGNLSLIELDFGDEKMRSETTVGYLNSAKKAGQRAADLVRQLLGFSRQSTLRMRRCNVGDIITEVQDLLHASISPEIEIGIDVEPQLWDIEADSTQIQQVLMNMCVNARDALPDGRGRIVMAAANTKISRKESAHHGTTGTEFVRFSISDDGSGIPPEVLEKIWEPFFTTKEQGKGTGLGLATSYGIVQQHGGWIDCESLVGKGTTFHVFVPRRVYAEEETKEIVSKPLDRGSETILLVDDEVMVRTVAKGFFMRQGYEIVAASDGLEAIEIIEKRGDEIDLVLLDLTMPRLSGKDTFRKIREMHPEMPVVICSGYLLDIGEFESETGFRPSGMVQKPYQTEDLLSTARKAIDARPRKVVPLDVVGV